MLACPSTGNLANAVAAAAARAGIRSVVLVPADLELQKIITTAVYGGTFVTVDGTYDDVNRLASELAGEHEDWAFVNVNVRPYYAEGSKTIAFEIAEQLGWRLPAQVVVPIASGAQLVKVDKGFTELTSLGLVASRRGGCSAPRRPAARRCRPRSPPGTTWCARSGRTRSPSRWPSATRPTGPTCSTWCGAPAARSPTSATPRSSTRSGCWPDRGYLRRDRRRGHPGRAAQAARRGQLDPDAETVIINSGDGLKTLDAIAGAIRLPDPSAPPSRRSRRQSRERAGAHPDHPAVLHRRRGGGDRRAGTLREIIAGLDAAYPGLGGRLLDDGGQLRRFVNVYVGEEDVRFAQGLDTPVAAGARVSVIPAVAGAPASLYGDPADVG